jgi:hypothetical protein
MRAVGDGRRQPADVAKLKSDAEARMILLRSPCATSLGTFVGESTIESSSPPRNGSLITKFSGIIPEQT